VVEHRARVRVVLAKRADQAGTDPARAFVTPGVARPVDEARDEIRGERSERDSRQREGQVARAQRGQPAGEVIGGQ
jgi:hypothetical protein